MTLKIKYIKLPKIIDDCVLIFGQNSTHFPFKIQRVFLVKDAKPDLPRGYHAHKVTKQVLFCINGSVKLTLDNGKNKRSIKLNKPEKGVLIDNLIWHEMHDFTKDTILMVLASEKYKEKDYIRNYHLFKKYLSK